MQIDKVHGDLAFNEEYHKYWNTKNPDFEYTSITTLIGKFHEEFNEEFFSRYKALERLISAEDFKSIKSKMLKNHKWNDDYNLQFGIDNDQLEEERKKLIAEWRAKNKEATDRGSKYHLERELQWYADNGDIEKVVRLLKKFNLPIDTTTNQDYQCEQNNFDLIREKAVMPEFLIYYSCPSNIVHLAGQVDLLIKDGNDIYILDYKTNADGIKSKAYFNTKTRSTKRMHYPINNLDDTVMVHYNLQLSLYAWMLKKMHPEFNIKLLRLIHIDKDNNETTFDVPYLEEECTTLLKHWKKVKFVELRRKGLIGSDGKRK